MTETGKLTPYINMNDVELSEYERYCFNFYREKPLYNWDWYWDWYKKEKNL